MTPIFVVAGGSTGLGRQISRELSARGRVVVLSPFQEELDAVVADLECDAMCCDISRAADVDCAVGAILERYERIDGLVNSAAVWIQEELEMNDPVRIARVVEVNVTGAMLIARAVIGPMRCQGGGRIINVVSQAGLYPSPTRSVYASTKAAMAQLTRSLERELAPYNINVGGIYPGRMPTGFYAAAGNSKDMSDEGWLDPAIVACVVSFMFSLPLEVVLTDLTIKHLKGS